MDDQIKLREDDEVVYVTDTSSDVVKLPLEYLDLLQEECSELAIACSKIKRFGLHDVYEGKTNERRLMEEAGDVLAILNKLRIVADFEAGDACKPSSTTPFITEIEQAFVDKFEKLKIYGPHGSYLKRE